MTTKKESELPNYVPEPRIVTLTSRCNAEDEWELEVDAPPGVSPYEIYAMLELAYFRYRTYMYPGFYADPEESGDEDEDDG